MPRRDAEPRHPRNARRSKTHTLAELLENALVAPGYLERFGNGHPF